jgi:hypothetical protein
MRANRNLDSRMLIAVVKVGLDKMVLLLVLICGDRNGGEANA